MTPLAALLELQYTDTKLDQLRHRRARASEHDRVAAAHGAIEGWEKRRAEVRAQLAELAAHVEAEEARGVELNAQQVRLEQQLRTVISPRAAEALMHEIDTVKARHSELDDAELDHLEAQERLEGEAAGLDASESDLRAEAVAADAALSDYLGAADSEIDAVSAQRDTQQESIPADLVARYESTRPAFGGVAIARLNGRQCEGCHLDISAAEIDALKATPHDQLPECPQCGRLLLVDG
jgi:predicted  nucleic acid-binding Zn-ribbon protein